MSNVTTAIPAGFIIWEETLDVSIYTMSLAFVAIGMALSYIVQLFVHIPCFLLCGRAIRRNDKSRSVAVDLNSQISICTCYGLASCHGLTSSRVQAYKLMASWVFFVCFVAGLFVFYKYVVTLLGSVIGSFAVLMIGFVKSNWIWSFILRFCVLYNDEVRVGDTLFYGSTSLTVIRMNVISVLTTGDRPVMPSTALDESLILVRHTSRTRTVYQKSVPYTTLLDPALVTVMYTEPRQKVKAAENTGKHV